MGIATNGDARPRHFEVDGLRIEALEWGPEGGVPVLALHGWMDHAGGFQELAPRLTGCHVVALDLSGQGLSGHRAAHATYNIWDDLPQIVDILDLLGWADCVVMGHSRGANISTLLAVSQPDRVRALIALDSIVTEPTDDEAVVRTLRAFVDQTRASRSRPPRTFESRAAYIKRRREQGNSERTSEALADRALETVEEGVRMRGDARLFASSAMKFTPKQVEVVLASIQCAVLNIWAEGGIKATRPKTLEIAALAENLIGDYAVLDLPGDHHFHLDPDVAQRIAEAVLDFLERKGGTVTTAL